MKVIDRVLLSSASAWGFTAIAKSTGTTVRDCDGKGKLGSKSNQFEMGKQKAHDCKIVTKGYFSGGLIQKYFSKYE